MYLLLGLWLRHTEQDKLEKAAGNKVKHLRNRGEFGKPYDSMKLKITRVSDIVGQ